MILHNLYGTCSLLKKEISEYKKGLSIAEADAKYIQHVKKSMTDLAKKLGWSDEEIARLDSALNKLGVDGDSIINSLQIVFYRVCRI